MICAHCHGVGRMEYERSEKRVAPESTVTVREYGSHLCGCRALLPPREGRAQWWDSELILSETLADFAGDPVMVRVSAEVPISADNYRLVRRGNRYFPTFVNLDLETHSERVMFNPEQARELAAALVKAADAADAVDQPDSDACGHWAPCDCQKVPA